MRYYCISDDPDVLTGMRLAGVDGVCATTSKEVEAAVAKVSADPSVAVLLVTDGCYALYPERLDELKLTAEHPLVNIISDSRGSRREPNFITRLINEAIGIKI
ncbi:MAG TPA: ATP synthase subunit F [Clostridiales bacterium]|nr:ATP synthase subunit F [Clostridiales bacterium]HBR07693.1 ATP synthase subunit F [Clostridiales bacterium]